MHIKRQSSRMENLGRLTAPKCRGPTFASKTLQAEKPRRAQEATTITIRGTPQAPIHGGGPSDGRTWRGVLRTPLLPCSATPSLSDRARSQRKKKNLVHRVKSRRPPKHVEKA